LEIALFGIYLFLFTWIVTRTGFFRATGLSGKLLAILFLIRVISGMLYGWMGYYQDELVNLSDTWTHHRYSLEETRLLLSNPRSFFGQIFSIFYFDDPARLFSSNHSNWNDLKWTSYDKLMAFFNCFSFGNYYINIIFYNFITFFGVVAVFRIFRDYLKTDNLILTLGCFLVPSFLFWSSGLHKDGLSFLAIALVLFHTYFGILKNGRSVSSWLVILAGMFILFILRNHLLVVLLPAWGAWVLTEKTRFSAVGVFLVIYFLGIGAFFGLKYAVPSLDFPAFVVEKQKDFNELKGNSSIPVTALEPRFTDFIKTAPQAFSMAAFRPYISDIYKPIVLPAYLGILGFWLLVLLWLIFRFKSLLPDGFGLALFFFSVSVIFVIGFTVNNLGAIVRYRSILFPLLVPVLLSGIPWRNMKLHTFKLK
jgi:hypothetical protein